MVMEYLPGGDCFTLLQSFGFLEENLARWFCAEALLGLQYLHGCSIIHRDVKCILPSNVGPRPRASSLPCSMAAPLALLLTPRRRPDGAGHRTC